MFALVMLIAAAIALPLGLIVGHVRKGAFLAVNAAGIGRAIPSFAVLAFAFPLALRYHLPGAFAFWPTPITLVVRPSNSSVFPMDPFAEPKCRSAKP